MTATDRQRVRTMQATARALELRSLEDLCARALYTDDHHAVEAALMRWEIWRITHRLCEVTR